MKVIKQFGLPRSCTNATEVLIRKNFKVRIYNNFPCWKHGENTIEGRSLHCKDKSGRRVDTDDLKFLVCTKHPYDWLWSLYHFEKTKPRVKDRTLDQFLRQKNTFHYPNQNAIDVFNQLTKHWLKMFNDQSVIQQITNEQLLNNQIAICERLQESFGLQPKHAKFVEIEKTIKPGLVETKTTFTPRKRRFTQSQIDYIKGKLDARVVKMAGYSL
jgi:hypothetical protein